MKKSLAFYNHGAWKAMCPECPDARAVYHPQTGERLTQDVCAAGHPFEIVMPPPELEAQIVAVLSERAAEPDKSWYPRGHQWAMLNGFPTGQSVEDLLAENREVARFRAAQDEARKARLAAILAEHGIEVRPDGTFEGVV
jgi:hypothetical protein